MQLTASWESAVFAKSTPITVSETDPFDCFQHNQVLSHTKVMLLTLSLLIFFAACCKESYQRLCENPRTFCLTGNLYNTWLNFFSPLKRSLAGWKNTVFLRETLILSPIILHKHIILSLISLQVHQKFWRNTLVCHSASCLLSTPRYCTSNATVF